MELWARKCPVILPKFRLPRKFRDLLHAANLRHGTDGFTSPLKEGVLRIFYSTNIRRIMHKDQVVLKVVLQTAVSTALSEVPSRGTIFVQGHFAMQCDTSPSCDKSQVHPCTGTEALYRPYGPYGE